MTTSKGRRKAILLVPGLLGGRGAEGPGPAEKAWHQGPRASHDQQKVWDSWG